MQKENLLSLLYFDSTFFPEEPCLLGEDVWGGPEGVRAGDPGGAGQLKPGGDPGGAGQLKLGGGPGGSRQLKPLGDPGHPRDSGDPGGAGQLKPPAFFPHPILPP